MAKYAIEINETVIHKHRVIVECTDKNSAEQIADKLFEKARAGNFDHHDDVVLEAEKMTKVLDVDENYGVFTEDITIGEDEVCEIEL